MRKLQDTKLTSAHQTAVPPAVRNILRAQAGDRIEWFIDQQGEVVIRKMKAQEPNQWNTHIAVEREAP